jgi:hypothetical protein
MYFIGMELDTFDSLPFQDRVAILRRGLDMLCEANLRYIRNTPWVQNLSIYDWAPKYEIKPRPWVPAIKEQADIWQDIPSTMRRGTGDCKDFCAARCAELYFHGLCRQVGFHVKPQQVGDLIVYHIQIEGIRPDGVFVREDPSKLLGMPVINTEAQLQQLMNG